MAKLLVKRKQPPVQPKAKQPEPEPEPDDEEEPEPVPKKTRDKTPESAHPFFRKWFS